MRILVVDDERGIREALKDILDEEGYFVKTVPTGRKALEIIPDFQPDIVILDLFLPGVPGIEVLEKLSVQGMLESMAVIVISGHGTIEMAVRAIKLGAFDFIEKPINLSQLIDAVERCKRKVNLYR